MKRLILHIVLLNYTLVMLKPALPYVSDLVGHIFFYTQHMATVHVEDGKMHIHKEIVDNAKKAASQKEIPAAKKDNTAHDHLGQLTDDSGQHLSLSNINPVSLTPGLAYIYLFTHYPPPRS